MFSDLLLILSLLYYRNCITIDNIITVLSQIQKNKCSKNDL